MPQINIKLFAHLRDFMPEKGIKGSAPYNCPDDNTVNSVLRTLNVPLEHCHLVLLNGVFVLPENRESQNMTEGDTLAVWPPVAGG